MLWELSFDKIIAYIYYSPISIIWRPRVILKYLILSLSLSLLWIYKNKLI